MPAVLPFLPCVVVRSLGARVGLPGLCSTGMRTCVVSGSGFWGVGPVVVVVVGCVGFFVAWVAYGGWRGGVPAYGGWRGVVPAYTF